MNIDSNFPSDAERQLFIDIFFEFEAAVAFNDSEMELLNSEIQPSVVIHTISHALW